MRICNAEISGIRQINTITKNNSRCYSSIMNTRRIENSKFSNYSAANVKAKFLPSFYGYRKAGKTYIKDKKTQTPVLADIKRNKIGDFISFKLMVGREEAGYLDMVCDSIFPEEKYVLTQPYNNIPEICHLRSIMGDKYSGIGTELIKTAIQESCNQGGFGNLWLKAEKGYARTLSEYRSDENPIPFYYKVGFCSPDPDMDKFIKKCIDETNYYSLPDSTLLLLTPEARNKWLEQLVNNPIIRFKEDPIIA